ARRPVVLVVDDGAANRELIEACLAGVECHVRTAEDGPAALKSVQASPPDLVLLDVQMPGMDGYEVCRRIKGISATRLVPVVMITSLDQTNDRVRALEAGADDYMTKPVDRVELVARVRSALRLKGVYDSLDSAEHVIFALAAAVEAKDPYTEAHTQRVADAARAIGSRMNLPLSDLDALYRGGLIHDIGKIGIPDAILLKPGPLDPRELAIMQQHPMMGENIVAPLRSGASLLPIIRHHHERFDGTGYPDRLSGAGIPRLARGCAVCDALDSRVSERLWPAGFARCAYALLRYRDSLIPPPRRWHVAAVASLAAASVTLLAAQAVTANRAVVLAIAVAWILVWCVCVGEPIVRFWLVARRLPAVQGWRLRSLSLGFGGLVLVLLL